MYVKPLKASSSSDPTYSSEFRLEEETSLDVFCSFILFCIDELMFTWSVSLWIWVKQKRTIFWSWTRRRRRRGTWRWVWWQKWVSLFHIISFYDLLQTLRDRCQKFLLSGAAGERDELTFKSQVTLQCEIMWNTDRKLWWHTCVCISQCNTNMFINQNDRMGIHQNSNWCEYYLHSH